MKIEKILASENVARDLKEEELFKIGEEAFAGYDTDNKSNKDWRDDLEKWTKLALQIVETKTYPWKGASNVKYPLLSTAAMQFNARAYPTLVPSDGKVVRCKVIGADPDGMKGARALRVSKHMSTQIIDEMDDWEESMDKLLLILPITGTAFKKTYFDPVEQKNCSELIYPTDLVVNYWAKDIESAERITQKISMSKRKVLEKQRQGIYLEVDLPDPRPPASDEQRDSRQGFTEPEEDSTTPYQLLEQHTWLDLDKDGYAEPYVILFEEQSHQILRIAPRFMQEDVLLDEKQRIVKIAPTHYFTKFSFVPNPDGGFYDIGFGRLLGSLNASADTLVNQLIDAGTLSNLQAGFIGKGLRIKMGESSFAPGEWKAVNATGDDIKKQIFPLPTREPSAVLMQLLQFLLQSGKELASVAEIFVGKMPGQNTPATTTMASIEQGMKVFTAVYKRVYRALTKEFRKLYLLNQRYQDPEQYVEVINEKVPQSDYAGKATDVIPAADPQATQQQDKVARIQNLLQLMALGTLNPMEVTALALDAYDIPNKEKLMIQQPQADPKQQAAQQQAEQKNQEMQMKAQLAQTESQHKIAVADAQAKLAISTEQEKAAIEIQIKEVDLQYKKLEAMIKGQTAAASHQASMQQGAEKHVQDMQIKSEAAKNTKE